MNYLPLSAVVTFAVDVLNIEPKSLLLSSRIELADSAVHAPKTFVGEDEVYPSLAQKIGILGYRLVQNHPFPKGNKRVAFIAMKEMADINGADWIDLNGDPKDPEVVKMMLAAAAGTVDEDTFINWVGSRVKSLNSYFSTLSW